ncbi:hypothetical protein SH1V18_12470 [Vallitalea longa]|uniref:Uncharacterized protein n=1 Tax=Vallitalea longa TaxID=2936439 RepID=A0A9W5Y8H7_9FIRM|nr:hypothetical protein [Vallitalea longa]GKX28767.1 hypothetical protein SH1V18_12470 [Vallitalea longa]
MQILKVVPGKSIGEIEIGMDRQEVYRIIGTPKKQESIEWIDEYHIEYANDKVIFIEVPDSFRDTHFVLFEGVDLFRTEAKLLVKYISEYGKYDETDCELGYSYSFKELGIGLWRPVIFEYDMLDDPEFQELDPEIQQDEFKHLFFESICVFVKDYYKK